MTYSEHELEFTFAKKCKIRSNGVMWGSRGPFLEFWARTNIWGTIETENSKFGTEMDGNEY